MIDKDRPSCIVHWTKIEGPDNKRYSGDDELMAIGAPLARHLGLTRIGIHHLRVPPGRRTSFPHAESLEEEFVYVIAGTPEVWLDGEVHRLKPGDSVGFPAGTGLAHTFINNSDQEAELLVIGEANKDENRIFYPKNPERRAMRSDWWEDVPERSLGSHDGMPDAVRVWKATKGSSSE